jgi:hypothetical protein
VRFVAVGVLDDVAYGLGVWRGCLRVRSLAPLRPRVRGRAAVRAVTDS